MFVVFVVVRQLVKKTRKKRSETTRVDSQTTNELDAISNSTKRTRPKLNGLFGKENMSNFSTFLGFYGYVVYT